MQYVSTRGKAPQLGFSDVLLTGLATDGGLYLPVEWPNLTVDDLVASLGPDPSYQEVALEVLCPFTSEMLSREELNGLIQDAYATFSHPDIAPLKEIGDNIWILELFHGPTLAFKDVALQLVGQLFDYELAKRQERMTIVGATSGDTGSAAIEACRDREAIDIFILHPHGRTSDVQRRQMTTVESTNVHNIAIEGTFDDCQDIVKAMFLEEDFRSKHSLSAVNSINWARVMAQTAYYWWSAICLRYAAHLMGLDLAQFVVGSNNNDVLDRFFQSGEMEATKVVPTLSPSMDIQIPSNFERLLFEIHDRDGERVVSDIEKFRNSGNLRIGQKELTELQALWTSARIDDEKTLSTISDIYNLTGDLIDPHTAVGIAAAKERRKCVDNPIVCLATAHPGKFPEAVREATGVSPNLPLHLSDLHSRKERYSILPNDLNMVKNHVETIIG
jgi:threonine synthase